MFCACCLTGGMIVLKYTCFDAKSRIDQRKEEYVKQLVRLESSYSEHKNCTNLRLNYCLFTGT